jgi:hypothetical protein
LSNARKRGKMIHPNLTLAIERLTQAAALLEREFLVYRGKKMHDISTLVDISLSLLAALKQYYEAEE